ncbi:sterol 26-hydroxylase, mitochondrial [Nerophis lumbriciformis]|uniref:sterol 26-hydroxylase, mitochondrial n=1 Tax=Nerophis lumbriciformis TaxID=546530 RepID=UPI002ADF4382|nr:sterol 26-hydroxylase, mitochondrial-like [Nerophis lumbriciformis]
MNSSRPGLSALCRGLIPLSTRTLAQETTGAAKLKTIEDLPGPTLSTTLFWLFAKGYKDKSHLLQGVQKNLYGPIWRSKFGPFDLVNVASPELIAQVIRQEGRYPVRAELPHWKEYRELRGQAYGLHVDKGQEWYRMRSALNPKLLRLQEVSAYAPIIHQVVEDFLQRIEFLRIRSPDQATVPDVAAELYKFGFEAISSILFETRLGCLQEDIPEDTERFIAAVNDMLTLSETVVVFPRWMRSAFPFWERFVQAWDDLYNIAQTLIDKRLCDIHTRMERGEPTDGLYLTYLLSCDKLTQSEIYICVTELLLGGVDTTSNTLSWALYHLARDQRVQDRLYSEVNAVCANRRKPDTDDLRGMPYLKAVIKETLRLYPVVPGNGRFTAESEVIVDNYRFPKKTQFHLCHYVVSRDRTQFTRADDFLPERWLRTHAFQHHPYSFIPFGVGVRGCVGRRVAEMEMYFALSRLVQQYEVRPGEDSAPIEAKTRTLLIPARPINLRFLPRT